MENFKEFQGRKVPILKLIFLFTLTQVFWGLYGCGKKISSSPSPSSSTFGQDTESILTLSFASSEGNFSSYTVPKNVKVKIPSSLMIKAGSAIGKVVTITYNVVAWIEDVYMFKCYYKNAIQPGEIPLDQCQDRYGNDLGNVTEHDFPLHQGKLITISTEEVFPYFDFEMTHPMN